MADQDTNELLKQALLDKAAGIPQQTVLPPLSNVPVSQPLTATPTALSTIPAPLGVGPGAGTEMKLNAGTNNGLAGPAKTYTAPAETVLPPLSNVDKKAEDIDEKYREKYANTALDHAVEHAKNEGLAQPLADQLAPTLSQSTLSNDGPGPLSPAPIVLGAPQKMPVIGAGPQPLGENAPALPNQLAGPTFINKETGKGELGPAGTPAALGGDPTAGIPLSLENVPTNVPTYGGPGKVPALDQPIPKNQLAKDSANFNWDPSQHSGIANLEHNADMKKGIGGFFDKLGAHALGGLTDLGDVVAPEFMERVPGTPLDFQIKQQQKAAAAQQALANTKTQSEINKTNAETGAIPADTALKVAQTSEANAKAAAGPSLGTPQEQLTKAYLDQASMAPGTPEYATQQKKIDAISQGITGAKTAENSADPGKQIISASDYQNFQKKLKLLEAGMSPDAATTFEAGFGASPNDTRDELDKKFEEATKAATANGSEQDRLIKEAEDKQKEKDRIVEFNIAQANIQAQRETTHQLALSNQQFAQSREVDSQASKAYAPIAEIIQKDSDKIDKLNAAAADLSSPNGMKNAMGVIQTLTGVAGGAGSGVKVTGAEIQLQLKTRGWTDSAKVNINNALDPGNYELMSDNQREAMKGTITYVQKVVNQRLLNASSAATKILHAQSIPEIRNAESEYTNSLTPKETGLQGHTGGGSFDPNKLPKAN